MPFAKEVAAFALKAKQATDKEARKITLDAFRGAVLSAPVDTGRLRGSLQIGVNQRLTNDSRVDKSGRVVIGEVLSTLVPGIFLKDVSIYLTTNVVYAERVEFEGWSHTKAPAGFMRLNIQRVAAKYGA